MIKQRWLISVALLVVLAVLLVAAPAEARLGNVVKIVYLHGAAERVATYAYVFAGGLGSVYLATRAFGRSPVSNLQAPISRWTRAVTETAIGFWFAHIVISAPAQILAWGAFTLNEPRVASALVVLVATVLIYATARWMGDALWLASAAIANAVILAIVLRRAVNLLHPVNPILGSDSTEIKVFYAAIVAVMGVLALVIAQARASPRWS